METIRIAVISGLWNLFAAHLPLVMVAYAIALMLLGPQRAGAFMARSLRAISIFSFQLFGRVFVIGLKTVVNTSTLTARLTVSAGQPERITEAYAKYLERMADAVL